MLQKTILIFNYENHPYAWDSVVLGHDFPFPPRRAYVENQVVLLFDDMVLTHVLLVRNGTFAFAFPVFNERKFHSNCLRVSPVFIGSNSHFEEFETDVIVVNCIKAILVSNEDFKSSGLVYNISTSSTYCDFRSTIPSASFTKIVPRLDLPVVNQLQAKSRTYTSMKSLGEKCVQLLNMWSNSASGLGTQRRYSIIKDHYSIVTIYLKKKISCEYDEKGPPFLYKPIGTAGIPDLHIAEGFGIWGSKLLINAARVLDQNEAKHVPLEEHSGWNHIRNECNKLNVSINESFFEIEKVLLMKLLIFIRYRS